MTATTTCTVRRAGTMWNKLSLGASRCSSLDGFATDVTKCQVPSQAAAQFPTSKTLNLPCCTSHGPCLAVQVPNRAG